MTNQNLQCPFCGAEPEIADDSENKHLRCSNYECYLSEDWIYYEIWNSRLPHPEIPEVPEPWLVNDSPKKPRKTIEIECCFHCKWICYSESNDAPTYCNLSDKLIPDLNIIPDFCLLEDAK